MRPVRQADAIEEEAINWMVDLGSGEGCPRRQADFRAWLAADPRHARAWERLGRALDATLGEARRPQARAGMLIDAALQRGTVLQHKRRRLLGGLLGLAGLTAGGLWMGRMTGLIPDLGADLRTAVAERRGFELADGSSVLLDAQSSLDVRIERGARRLSLRAGQLIATVQADPAPFVIDTAHGSIRALGRRLMVRTEKERSMVVALEGHALALPPGDTDATWENARRSSGQMLHQGQTAWLRDGRLSPPAAGPGANSAATWARGMVEALDMPLAEVVAALRPYRLGMIRVEPEVAGLRVTGAFPLDDTDAALAALSETLPVRVRAMARGLVVSIQPA